MVTGLPVTMVGSSEVSSMAVLKGSFLDSSVVNTTVSLSWPENQGILFFFYISKTLEMIRISFMASLLNAVL